MSKRLPPLLTRGNPLRIDGMSADLSHLKGVFYCDSLTLMMKHLRSLGEDFYVTGSPSKGPRAIKGKGYEVIDPYRAWLFDEAMPIEEVYDQLIAFDSTLHDDFRNTAAKTFGKLCGKVPWIEDQIAPWAKMAYTGGLQWSRPGVYLRTTTSDMREAYYWAMHKMPLSKGWSFVYGPRAKPNLMSIVCAKVVMKGTHTLPLLPSNIGKMTASISIGNSRNVFEGYWHGPDFMMAMPHMESYQIHWCAYAQPTFIMQKRMNLDPLPKAIRKRLSLVGYGIHAQSDRRYEGTFAGSYYEACRRMGSTRLKSTHYDTADGTAIWWTSHDEERKYVRMDWAGLVTSRVRYKLINEAKRIQAAGGGVARIYVDSITATIPVLCGFGDKPGDFKNEGEGVSIVGPPGVCMIAGEIKHSGMPIDRAAAIIDSVRNGTYELNGEENWTGLTESIPTD